MKKDYTNSNYNPRFWTLEEKSIMRTYYGHVSTIEIINKLYLSKIDYKRSANSVHMMAKKMNLSKNNDCFPWSNLELLYLENHKNSKSYKEIALDLNRSISSVKNAYLRYFPHKVNNITPIKFTDEEIQFLKDNNEKGITELSKILNRHKFVIKEKMINLNIYSKKICKRFTDEEIQFLKDNLHLSIKDISLVLNRNIASIRVKIKSIKG